MSATRSELQKALLSYTTDTLTYINTVRRFCEKLPKWIPGRKSELSMMMDIKERADGINKRKGTAFVKYMKNKVTPGSAKSQREELEMELTAVLKDTVVELEKLHVFLDVVEKLAVTSLHVFVEYSQVVFHLPEGVDLDHVLVVIAVARLVCPLLLEFKRDPNVFFLPKLQNVEVLAYQLDRYIQTTQRICALLEKSTLIGFSKRMIEKTAVSLSVDLSEDNVQRMLKHTEQLEDIRMNQDFRLVFLFADKSCSVFLDKFSDCQPRMLQCLTKLEEVAVQLDSMNKGAKISGVVGSSVGAIGGVLSIVGLVLIPVTAGLSLGLTVTGMGLSVTSGVNGAVTTATEIGVNRTKQKKAGEVFQQFMEDVQSLQGCLEEVSMQNDAKVDAMEVAVGAGKVLGNAGLIVRGIDASSAVKLLKAEDLVAGAAKTVAQEGKALRNVPKVAADIPDIGQAALKGPLALSKSARAGFIGLNALFLGMDVFLICKDSISLSKGSETKVSKFIRARSTLWRSEIDVWKKIHDSLSKGQSTAEENRIILDTPFYPE